MKNIVLFHPFIPKDASKKVSDVLQNQMDRSGSNGRRI